MLDKAIQLKSDLKEILDLLAQQLKLGESGEWEQVAGLELKRQQLIKKTFNTVIEKELHSYTAESIAKIQVAEKKLLTLVERGKSDSKDQLTKLNVGNKAVKAYKKFL